MEVAQAVEDERGGDIDAIEDVADVVEDIGGDLGLAGLSGRIEELLVNVLDFLFHPFAFFDFLLQGGFAAFQFPLGADAFMDFLPQGVGSFGDPGLQ